MHISHVVIRNFRALADIECDFGTHMNVIVGPNAVGKTTILQGIRLAKAILAPRTQQESMQVLISLGAASPHFPQRLFLKGLAREASQEVEVRCTYVLTEQEIGLLRFSVAPLVQAIVASRLGNSFSNPAALIQFIQSTQGQHQSAQITEEVRAQMTRLERDRSLVLGISINGATGQITAVDTLAGPLVAFLDQRLAPSVSIFTYFPADRALPIGDVNLQIGGPDAQQQLESHNSQPQLKYARLKHLIISSLVIEPVNGQTVRNEFEKIFSALLKGRKIKTISVNELGLLSIMTEDLASKRLIELDSLSSGEKNIALTFLLIARSIAEGGVALFDEPELHLNPAVCRDVLSFMVNEYSKPRGIQFVMCTHSPEILSAAFSSDDCTLLHLKSSSEISRVGKRALDEYSDALQRLGTSVSESLLYEGTILVEGEDDVVFLEDGFPDLLKRFKVKDRGGRRGIEKTVSKIQTLEKSGQQVARIFVIFDRDEEPTTLASSDAVKILQWPRRCLENYMIDFDVLTELLKDREVTNSPKTSEGEVHRLLRELAYSQLDELAARDVYNSYGFRNASLLKADVQKRDIPEIAEALFNRMSAARKSIPDSSKEEWITNFKAAVQKRRGELLPIWEAKWNELCDGKKLISDLHKAADLRMSESTFKLKIAQRMRQTSSENWRLVKGILEDLVS